MKNTIIDNSIDELSMTKVLSKLWSDQDINEVKIATGYWDLKAVANLYNVIKPFLDREDTNFKILIGNDPYVYESMLKGKEKYKDCKRIGDFIKVDINELDLNEKKYVDAAKIFLDYADGDNPKIQIRLYDKDENGNKQLLHSKCYIFIGQNDSYGIIGSSNFTEKGLQDNAELNYLETDSTRVMATPKPGSNQKGHDCWFESMWKHAEDWTKEFLVQLRKSKVGTKAAEPDVIPDNQAITPYEVYIKYLQTQFGDIVDTSVDGIIKSYLPQEFKPLAYQIDAVKQCFSIMKRYDGFILGDVVGLGKTVVGVLLIRRFIEEAYSMGRNNTVLVITPPAIMPAWKHTIYMFDKDNPSSNIGEHVEFVTTGSLAHINNDFDELEQMDITVDVDNFDEKISERQYGLILIDESHNFRNKGTQKYEELDNLIGRLVPTPFVGLMSATPQNNSPEDLKNQIYLFQRTPNATNLPNVPGGKLDTFFASMQKKFVEAKKTSDPTQAKAIINEMSGKIRECVLNELVVRRTRSDVKQQYPEDSKNLKFPSIKGPHHLEYEMDTELVDLFSDTMTAICPLSQNEVFDPQKHIGFYRYQAICFLKNKEDQKLYEGKNLTVATISQRLQKLMQTLLVKRLESSFRAFKSSLQNLLQYTENMIEMINNGRIFICPDIDVNAEFFETQKDANGKETIVKLPFDAVAQKLVEKSKWKNNQKNAGNNKEFGRDAISPDYLEHLQQDRLLIKSLCERWDKNDFDPKIDVFKESIKEKFFDKKINNPQKLVIFTEAIDTQKELKRILNAKKYRVLSISAKNRDENIDAIKLNFDANCPLPEQRDDYDVIITTEVLAEGVNLHRANVILNFDEPWNSTRLIQRIGRVNRIGSKEDEVHVFNFFPSYHGNREIKLMEKSLAKLQAFHSMFGEDSKIFTETEELVDVDLSHLTDGDASPFGQYMLELKQYKKNNSERYKYLSELPTVEIGGKMQDSNTDESVIIFTDNSGGFINLKKEQDLRTHLVAPLQIMEFLKCETSAQFVDGFTLDKDSEGFKEARWMYQSHVVNGIKASDINKRSVTALGIVNKLMKLNDIKPETKKILRDVDKAIRHGNRFIISTLIKYGKQMDTNQLNLFGVDFDINMWIQSTFSFVAKQAIKKRGEASVAFYCYK